MIVLLILTLTIRCKCISNEFTVQCASTLRLCFQCIVGIQYTVENLKICKLSWPRSLTGFDLFGILMFASKSKGFRGDLVASVNLKRKIIGI